MSKSNTFETEFLAHILQNAAISGVGDAIGLPGSTAAGSLYFSLHTADPGEASDQSTSEAAYTGYARVAKGRNATDFTIAGNVGSVATDVVFPAGTAGTGTATHWGLGTASTGVGKLLLKGAISPSIVLGAGVTPRLLAGSVVTED